MPVPDTPVATPEVDAEHFTRAITELGEKRPVVAKQAIFNAQGVKIVEKGTAINASLYERLNAHKLPAPLEEALSAEGVVTGRSLRLDTELMLEREPFYARMTTTPTERSKRLDVVEKLPLPDAMAFQLTLARDLRPSVYRHSLRAMWTMVWLANSPLGKSASNWRKRPPWACCTTSACCTWTPCCWTPRPSCRQRSGANSTATPSSATC